MTIVAARTSQGKTAFGLQMAWDVARQGIPTLFLSLEMYEEDIIERLFCLSQRVDNFELLTGKFSRYRDAWEAFKQEADEMPLVITDMIGKTWSEVDRYLTSLTKKPKLIVIDHLQEARGASLRTEKEVIDEYLKKMRLMAIRDDFSIVICSQINRASQESQGGNEPQLHHLKSSGYQEECADVVILLYWPWHYTKTGNPNKYIVNVAKNRNGRTGWIDVCYKPEHYWFYEEVPEEGAQIYKMGAK